MEVTREGRSSAFGTMRRWMLVALTLGLIATCLLHWWRDFPWEMAAMSGVGVTGLVFVTLQTVERLRGQFGS